MSCKNRRFQPICGFFKYPCKKCRWWTGSRDYVLIHGLPAKQVLAEVSKKFCEREEQK
jgi:hypothetical protein